MSGIMDRFTWNQRRRSSAQPLLCITLFATSLLLSVGATFASDCPPNNPKDCEAAATTARNPLVPVAGAVAGGLLGLVTRRVIGGIISASPAPPEDWLKDWDLKANGAFCDLGRRLRNMSTFKNLRRDVDKAGYAFDRMLEVARRYQLRAVSGGRIDQHTVGYWRGGKDAAQDAAVTGGTAGFIAGGVIGSLKGAASLSALSVKGFLVGGLMGAIIAGALAALIFYRRKGFDPESVLPLKHGGVGNCGDWVLAFREVLRCAGVDTSTIVAGDDSKDLGFSAGFYGTDTTIMVRENLKDRGSWRIFDIFSELRNRKPFPHWSDLPAEQWLHDGVRKKFIKDYGGKVIYP